MIFLLVAAFSFIDIVSNRVVGTGKCEVARKILEEIVMENLHMVSIL